MLTKIIFISLHLLFIGSGIGGVEEQGHCVLRGICGKDPTVTSDFNPNLLCVDEGPPEEMPDKLKQLMKKVCPHFENEISSKICCTRRQIKDLKSNFESLDPIAGHCPTCLYNLKKVFCDFTCHPEQSKFLYASKKIWGNNTAGQNVEMVKELQYYVKDEFVNAVYNGCKDVLFPSQSMSIMGFLCGTAPSLCTPKKLLRYMGTPSRMTSPFLIEFIHSDENPDNPNKLEFYNPKVLPCNVPPPNGSTRCSCTNCELSCPNIDFEKYKPLSLVFYIGGIDGLSVIMGIVFLFFSAGFLFAILRRTKPNS